MLCCNCTHSNKTVDANSDVTTNGGGACGLWVMVVCLFLFCWIIINL